MIRANEWTVVSRVQTWGKEVPCIMVYDDETMTKEGDYHWVPSTDDVIARPIFILKTRSGEDIPLL